LDTRLQEAVASHGVLGRALNYDMHGVGVTYLALFEESDSSALRVRHLLLEILWVID